MSSMDGNTDRKTIGDKKEEQEKTPRTMYVLIVNKTRGGSLAEH